MSQMRYLKFLLRRCLPLAALCCAHASAGVALAQDTAAAPAATVPESVAATPAQPTFSELLKALPEASYSEKAGLMHQLIASGNPSTKAVLQALLESHLYQIDDAARADHGSVVITGEGSGELALTDPATLKPAGSAREEQLKRIGTNNSLRKTIKGLLAQLALSDSDPKARRAAVQELLRNLDESTVTVLRERQKTETDAQVRREIEVGLSLSDLDSSDTATRLAAVQHLSGELSPEVYNKLQPLAQSDADSAVRNAATRAVERIESWRKFYDALSTLFFGLSLGSVLVLAATGLAITFGVMGVINMAHGELMMIGAYTAYVMQLLMPQHITASLWLSIPAAFVVAGLFGVAIERGIVRFLYGRPLETLLATFGLSLILQQLVRSIFSPLNRSVQTPEFMSGSLAFNDAFSITYNRLYIIVFTLIVFALLQLVLKKTSLGLKVRAVSQNRAMARAMGVRSEWVDAATFGLGSGVAGIAGVALAQLTNVGPNLGQAYIIDSFMVVVFGGVGNLWGTLISGMSLGVVNKLLEPWAGAVMAKILVLVFLILFIQRRPRGLFPQKGRAAEN
ncbi:urea transport system permease protein [Solimonas aquatica]|uniref:Urea transport system permease protein n=1 Tax=Solimonas aquatica TaxID=489703 RepID=A0A1H9JE07_9GAMM|nr:urea ABC transporter permease subunit UrtB [Solimonas aquatica]SEQ85060.1 urea transport system permease protein [Solimonas aquatica]